MFGVALQISPVGLGIGGRVDACEMGSKNLEIKYYIKVSRIEKMTLLNIVMVWANKGVGWMEGEGGSWGVWDERSGFVGRDHRRCVISSGEQNVGGMCMEEVRKSEERDAADHIS